MCSFLLYFYSLKMFKILALGFSYTLKFLKSSLAPDSLSFPNLESVRKQCAFLFFGQRRGTSEVIFAKQDFNTLEMLLPNFSLFLVKFSSRYFSFSLLNFSSWSRKNCFLSSGKRWACFYSLSLNIPSTDDGF